MDKISIKAPAKINLSLDILERRCDGYHNVKMIMQSVGLYDTVTVSRNNTEGITITCNNKDVPTDSTNLVHKAAVAFFEHIGKKVEPICIEIDKKIPLQAGLAGGSTDCAATLIALKKIFEPDIENDKLIKIGATLGADVPFCFYGGTMLATGIGTDLAKLKDMPDCDILLIKPSVNVSTKEAYKKADSRTTLPKDSSTAVIDAINKQDVISLSRFLYNDFENILALNEIQDIKNKLISLSAVGACMSGSGPTVFGIFQNSEDAEKALNSLKKIYKDVFLCKPTRSGVI